MQQLTPKEEAIQLVEKFMPLVYCYLGSGMLSNDYDEKVAKSNAKECAIICVDKIIESHTDNLNGDNIKQKEHYQQVLQEISKL